MKEKIAVIGMSFQLPEAETREQLHWNLVRKKVSVRDVSDARKQLASGAVPDALQLAAVEDLALFDNSFSRSPTVRLVPCVRKHVFR